MEVREPRGVLGTFRKGQSGSRGVRRAEDVSMRRAMGCRKVDSVADGDGRRRTIRSRGGREVAEAVELRVNVRRWDLTIGRRCPRASVVGPESLRKQTSIEIHEKRSNRTPKITFGPEVSSLIVNL